MLTWPLVTVFDFIAQPETHIFLKPNVTRRAAEAYGFEFEYRSGPNWQTYSRLLDFAATIRPDLLDLRPRGRLRLFGNHPSRLPSRRHAFALISTDR